MTKRPLGASVSLVLKFYPEVYHPPSLLNDLKITFLLRPLIYRTCKVEG